MKRSLLLGVLLAVAAGSAKAQLTTKNGTEILPKQGEWGLGINANPVIDLVGNLVKINSGSTFFSPLSFQTPAFDNVITGKYFISDTRAYRARVRIGKTSFSQKNVVDDNTNADATVLVEDKRAISNTNVTLGFGIENRRGSTRLQGIYGAEASIFLSGGRQKFEYGNEITSTNNNPTSTNWGGNLPGGGVRVLEIKNGGGFGVGVRGFVGVEYFVLPKMSLGGEFGWGLSINRTAVGETTSEVWDGSAVKESTVQSAFSGTSFWGFDTDNFNGFITFNFYF